MPFPRYGPGDNASARHLNEMSRFIEPRLNLGHGSHTTGNQLWNTSGPLHQQRRVEITAADFDGDSALKTVELMAYDFDAAEWQKEATQGSWPYDPLDGPTSVGSKAVAYYDIQRGAWVFIGGGGGGLDAGGLIAAYDCANSTLDITVNISASCPFSALPDIDEANLITGVKDWWPLWTGASAVVPSTLTGSKAWIKYMYVEDEVTGDCAANWYLWALGGRTNCV